jgi:hypothetical protein
MGEDDEDDKVEEHFDDEGARNAHILNTFGLSLLTVLCPFIGIPLLVAEARHGRRLNSGEKVTEAEGELDEMVKGGESEIISEFKRNRAPGETSVCITNSAYVPPNPERSYGFTYVPGEVTKTTIFRSKQVSGDLEQGLCIPKAAPLSDFSIYPLCDEHKKSRAPTFPGLVVPDSSPSRPSSLLKPFDFSGVAPVDYLLPTQRKQRDSSYFEAMQNYLKDHPIGSGSGEEE